VDILSVGRVSPDTEGKPDTLRQASALELAQDSPGTTYHKRRDNPDDSGKEAECLTRLPAATVRVIRDTAPGPDATAVEPVVGMDLDSECGKPGERDKQVNCLR
jgi:hypothetical protein